MPTNTQPVRWGIYERHRITDAITVAQSFYRISIVSLAGLCLHSFEIKRYSRTVRAHRDSCTATVSTNARNASRCFVKPIIFQKASEYFCFNVPRSKLSYRWFRSVVRIQRTKKKRGLRQFRTVISRNQISGCARIVNSRYKHRWNGGSCAPYRDPPEGRRKIERGFVWKQKRYTCNERRSVRVPYLAISSGSIDRLWAFATIWIRNSPIYGLFLQLRQHAQNRERIWWIFLGGVATTRCTDLRNVRCSRIIEFRWFFAC